MGGILAEARDAIGLSLEQVEELAGGAVTARVLCVIERGRRRVSDDELVALARVYGLDPATLTPARRRFHVDLDRGVIQFDDAEYPLTADTQAPAAVVAEYLAFVRQARGNDVSSPLALRSADLVTLGTALGQDRASLRTQLRTAIETDGSTAAGPRAIGASSRRRDHAEIVDAELVEIVELVELAPPDGDSDGADRSDAATCTDLVAAGSTDVVLHSDIVELEPDVMAELESVYDEIAALSSRRYHIGKRRYRRRHRELLEREQGLLEQLGFESWSMLIIGIASGQAGLSRVEREPLVLAELSAAPVPPVIPELRQLDIPRPAGAHFRFEPLVPMRTSWSAFVSDRVDGTPMAPPVAPAPAPSDVGFRAQFSNESLFTHRTGPIPVPAAVAADIAD